MKLLTEGDISMDTKLILHEKKSDFTVEYSLLCLNVKAPYRNLSNATKKHDENLTVKTDLVKQLADVRKSQLMNYLKVTNKTNVQIE